MVKPLRIRWRVFEGTVPLLGIHGFARDPVATIPVPMWQEGSVDTLERLVKECYGRMITPHLNYPGVREEVRRTLAWAALRQIEYHTTLTIGMNTDDTGVVVGRRDALTEDLAFFRVDFFYNHVVGWHDEVLVPTGRAAPTGDITGEGVEFNARVWNSGPNSGDSTTPYLLVSESDKPLDETRFEGVVVQEEETRTLVVCNDRFFVLSKGQFRKIDREITVSCPEPDASAVAYPSIWELKRTTEEQRRSLVNTGHP